MLVEFAPKQGIGMKGRSIVAGPAVTPDLWRICMSAKKPTNRKQKDAEGRFPAVYILPLGLPLYWRNEQSGELRAAVMAYLNQQNQLTEEQFRLVRAYLRYWVFAPCWHDCGGQLAELRESVEAIHRAEEITPWLLKALDLCIDPF
jgi:hypothetical protein